MSIQYINASGTASNVGSNGLASASSQSVTQNQFLQLLVNEMQNQDPTQPVDETQTLTQLAQFSELEQMNNMNQTVTQGNVYSLIGKTVTASTSDSSGSSGTVSGVVNAVTVSNGTPTLVVNGQSVDPSSVTEVQ